jgi:alkyl sulfatase BDS1-like metallo-beta-lactamase superfamily hydrolase
MGGDVELITAPNGAVINAYKEKGFLPVTRPVLDGDVLTVAAVKMQFFTEYHFDTDDCLTVWLPGKKIALNNLVWPMMPNFYTPRGATYRDPFNWIDGL